MTTKRSKPRRRCWRKPRARLTYARFRTGLTFGTVRRMLWVDNPDPQTWRQKSRGAVLGLWHSIKQAMWAERKRRIKDARLLQAVPF